MKKKYVNGNLVLERLQKILLIMSIKALMMLFAFNTVFAHSFSQEKIDVIFEEETVENVLEYLKKNTNYQFFYKRELLSGAKVKGIKMYEVSITEVLDEILKKNGLDYSIVDGVVVVRKEEINLQQQNAIIIRGLVTDKDKNPLTGVTVQLKGLTIGTVTDSDGKYILNLPQMDKLTLVFSFIGMETQEVNYSGYDTINIILYEDLQHMEEVIITGYQRIRKSEMVGSTNTINHDELFYNGTNSIEQMLQGKLPGTVVINTDGLVGTRQKVRVRGTSTLLSNAEPVWVVDGIIQEDPIPFKTQDLGNMGDNFDMIRNFVGNSIAWLNPNDIEDITVLKDAAATVMYGVKAANGVIIIKTKRGKAGSLNINYSGNFSLTDKLNYKRLNLMNSKERIDVSREIAERKLVRGSVANIYIGYEGLLEDYIAKRITYTEFNERVKYLERVNTDWIDILYRAPFSYNNSVSISGGSEKVTYYSSIFHNKTFGIAKGNDSEQYGTSFNLAAYWNEKINIDMRVSGSLNNTNGFYQVDPYRYAIETSRVIPAYEENGDRFIYKQSDGYLFNIENEIKETSNKNDQRNLNVSLLFNYNIIPDLRFESSFGLGSTNTNGESFATEYSNYITKIRGYEYGEYSHNSYEYRKSQLPYGGEINKTESRNTSITWKNSLNYNYKINKHNFTLYAGQEIRSIKTKELNSTFYGYIHDRGKVINPPPHSVAISIYVNSDNPIYDKITSTIVDNKSNYVSYYGNLIYSLDDKYVISGSIRSDASNRFGQDRRARYLPVWSLGGRWNAHNEKWLKNSFVSELNIRVSYGWQGNVAENFGPDLIAYYPSRLINDYFGEFQLKIKSLSYSDLRWEKTKTINMGLDLGLVRNRFTISFEYYQKKTEDMIVYKEVPASYGVENMPMNGGNMLNRGFELNVNGTIIRKKDMMWSLSLNTSKNFNKLKSDVFSTEEWKNAASGDLSKKGYPVTSIWAFEFKGIDPETGFPLFDIPTAEEKPSVLNDATEYMKHMGKLEPDFTGGLSTVFRYKNISLSGSFNLSIGGKKFLYSMFSSTDLPSPYQNLPKEFTKRWKQQGDEKKTNIPGIPYYVREQSGNSYNTPSITLPHVSEKTQSIYEMYNFSDIRVVSASFLRCNNLNITYDFRNDILNSWKLKNVSLTASVSNPFIIMSKKFKGMDPEVDTGKQPISRTFSLGLNISF